MPKRESQEPTPVEHELLRLTFCGIVIASFFAATAASRDLKHLLSPSGTDATTIILALSAGFAFMYLLSIASALKYQGARYVDRFPLSVKVSHFFYDASINVFGTYILFLLVEWLDANVLHLPHSAYVWPIYIVLFSITYIVARVVWGLAQNAIEYYYDHSSRAAERLKAKNREANHG